MTLFTEFMLALCNIVVRFGSFINGEVDIFLDLKLVGYNTYFSEEGDTIFLYNMDKIEGDTIFLYNMDKIKTLGRL